MSFLDLKDRVFLVMGVANRKSVAYLVGRTLEEEGAKVVYSVRSPERRDSLASAPCSSSIRTIRASSLTICKSG